MNTDYAYVEQWNPKVNLPILDKKWLTSAEAETYYGSGRRFDIVPAAVHEGQQQEPRLGAPWVVTAWGEGVTAFTATFFTPGGSVRRTIEWKRDGDRAFTWIVVDYTYADDDTRHRLAESTLTVKGTFEADGSGTLTISDKSKPTVDRLSMDQVDVSGNWLDRPPFGEWGPLADPDFAATPSV